ncbi:MAG: class I SAM-dependent methyltransferase, partial [Desulfarculus sp.]|nr:class I SAM-dependent methyltransferase [Desulfarculus sp.]
MDTVLHPIDVSDARADGLSWSLQLPPGVPRGADQTDFFGSPLRLVEDGRDLGPGTALHTEIRDLGGGRFHHWLRTLYFSTPDGSDPRTNGRVYALAGAPMRVETGPWARRAAHEMNIAESFLVRFATLGVDVAGKDLLELGPGATLGASLLLACAGARVTVADRFPARFRPDTIPLYQLLERDWHMDTAPIAAVLAEGGFSAALRSVPEAAESLDSVADASMDVVISNAVLEHVRDIGQAARELRRVSRPGAWH